MKKIAFSKQSLRALKRAPANEAQRMRAKIAAYARDPASQANNVKKLKGRKGCRLRVGDWRVILETDGDVLAILDIGPRGGVYD